MKEKSKYFKMNRSTKRFIFQVIRFTPARVCSVVKYTVCIFSTSILDMTLHNLMMRLQ